MNVKFVWNGLKIDGELYKCSYSKGGYTQASGIPEEAITIYMRSSNTPRIEGLYTENGTDPMTDYFETDTIRVYPSSKYYVDALKAFNADQVRAEKKLIRYYEKQMKFCERGDGAYEKCIEGIEECKANIEKLSA